MKRVLRVLAWIYLAYLALVVLIIMPLLNFLPPWWVEKTYQRQLNTELVILNPFSLALEVRDATLSEPDGTDLEGNRFAALDRAAANLSTSGIWRPGWVLDELALEGVDMHLLRRASGTLNIDDLIQAPGGGETTTPEPEPEPEEEALGELPGVTVKRITLSAHRIQVTDEMKAEPYTTHWDDLQLSARDLSTVLADGQPYRLRLSDESGGSLAWNGELSLPDSHSAGHIKLDGIALRPIWRYIKDQVDFELKDARLRVAADYEVSWADELLYRIVDGRVDLTRLSLAPARPETLPETGIDLDAVEIRGIELNGGGQQVSVGEVITRGLDVRGWIEDDRVSLVEMLNTRFPPSEEPEAKSENPWRVQLGAARIEAAAVTWRTPFTDPPVLAVSPLNLAVENISWPPEAPSNLALDWVVNDSMTGQVEGELHLGSGDGDLRLDVARLPVPWFGPNIPEVLNARLDSGELGTQGELTLAGFAPQQISLQGAVKDFSIRMYGEEASITRWKALEWKGLKVALPSQRLELAELHLDSYSGRVHIREDGSLNVQHLLREDAEARAAEASSSSGEASSSGNHHAGNPAPAEEEPESEPWSFSAPAIYISDSEVDFMDESMPISFRTVIGDVNGEITGLDSDPAQSLAVDITGSVDGYAPVALGGSASPMREPPALDLGLSFEGMDLARLTPYSGTYAGYAIDRGTMNLAVKYSLEENRLQGDNKVIIKQLKLGDKVDSEKALDIPLKLGVALLSDANGVIDLEVPVSGNVDNPEFSLGSVIWGAFANLITKAVTAPFSLLASLVGSEDDLQQINYAAGSSELDEAGRQKLLDLAEALKQRPRLKLVLGGRLNPETDGKKLQDRLLSEMLLAEGLTEEDIEERSKDWAESIEARYQALPQAAPDEADPEAPPPSAIAQARAVRDQLVVPPAELKALAEERAASAKRFLVNEGQVEADRSVIEQTDPADEGNTFSGVELSVDA